jgi:hypothetical protein
LRSQLPPSSATKVQGARAKQLRHLEVEEKMKRNMLFVAALLFSSSPVLAQAAMENLGTVDVRGRSDSDVLYTRFGGPVESIQLRASDSSIDCRSVVARFGNGRSRQVYSGRLNEGRVTNVDLPGEARRLSSLTFNCRADERWGGRIRILADIGRHRNEWQRSPDWNRYYSQLFNWGSTNQGNGRDRDRDGIQDRVDRDRDGDGVSNYRDDRPNNPYRR